ncbi:hypothetical protein [Phytoactinopolyspora endophytica]|uniref:hypothetical protein n=1 Tax=Phytoactinopolyspora endophytica TaxID=1642495 RepID=UPI00101D8E7B|nr:hypothetical protein [Phytoactinopolyspora endophytica]
MSVPDGPTTEQHVRPDHAHTPDLSGPDGDHGSDGWEDQYTDPEHGDLWTGPKRLNLDEPGTPPSDIPPPDLPSPDIVPPEDDSVSVEELELALERAKLVADDCAAILKPALQAMEDGAWVSRSGDEFSLALEDNARIATESAERVVEIIEAELERRRSTGDVEPKVFMPADTGMGV